MQQKPTTGYYMVALDVWKLYYVRRMTIKFLSLNIIQTSFLNLFFSSHKMACWALQSLSKSWLDHISKWECGSVVQVKHSPPLPLSRVVLGFCFVKGDCLLAQPWFGILLGWGSLFGHFGERWLVMWALFICDSEHHLMTVFKNGTTEDLMAILYSPYSDVFSLLYQDVKF